MTGGSKKKNGSEATSSRTKQAINIRGTNLRDIGTKGSKGGGGDDDDGDKVIG